MEGDTDYAAYARQLQDNWRRKNNFPIGSYKNRKGEIKELGNYIESEFAMETGANFLSPNILSVVKDALKTREKGAKIEKKRLFTNLLSSQPLAFNLFAELKLNKALALSFFDSQFPNRILEIEDILFEHSSGRGDCNYTCDHSAFDVFVKYKSIRNKNGFIGIEVKYSESLTDKPSKDKPRYKELSEASGLFKPESFETLRKRPIQQIWRDHLLAIAHLSNKNEKFDEGCFVYLFPKKNAECQKALNRYIKQFRSFDPFSKKYDEYLTGFYIRYLDDYINQLISLSKEDWAYKLKERYLG